MICPTSPDDKLIQAVEQLSLTVAVLKYEVWQL